MLCIRQDVAADFASRRVSRLGGIVARIGTLVKKKMNRIGTRIFLQLKRYGDKLPAMKVTIAIFDCLDRIAQNQNINDTDWAKAAILRRPTIPELRRLSREMRGLTAITEGKVKRACTVEKIDMLLRGLRLLVEGDILKKELKACIEREMDQDVRLMLYALALREAKSEVKKQVELSMSIAVDTIADK